MISDLAGRFRRHDRPVRHRSLAFSVLGPCGLFAAGLLAEYLLGGVKYSSIGDTMSVLASIKQTAVVTTIGFVWCSLCQIITATGLPVRRIARIALAVAGVCGLVVAACPVGVNAFPGMTTIHFAAAAIGTTILAIWPLLSASRAPGTPLPFRPVVATMATIALLALLAWLLSQSINGSMLGLVERLAVYGGVTWPAIATWWAYRHYRDEGRLPARVTGATEVAGAAEPVGVQPS
ncbi:DUF998 domain-containing protein [Gordonia sp. CPCC 206044]|uniref:DUF998 domain-containing protein n=1 Tax=Gordonia sp. CPCC 206044 TaxID=3140793 RepID=UPI003AF35636